jgi:tetratricopeptide (TPR) repeat protein
LLRATLPADTSDSTATMAPDALHRATELGLIEPRADGSLVLHRLLAAFLRHEAGPELEPARAAVEQTVLDAAGRLNAAGYTTPLARWRSHLQFVAEQAAQGQTSRAGGLLDELGVHLQMVAEFAAARGAHESALAIDQAALGPKHPDVAIRLNNLGLVLQDLGDLAGARTALERALAISEAALGPKHPAVARDVNNLGNVLQDLGGLAGARAAFERALAIGEATLGPDHPNVAIRLNNLGDVLRALGDLAGARAAFERALRIFTAALPPGHPTAHAVQANLDKLRSEESMP